MNDNDISPMQVQFIIQSLQAAVSQQTATITQTIHSQLNSEEYYSKLIELVEKITTVNTQMVENQNKIKTLLEEQVIPAFSCIELSDSRLKKTIEDTQLLYYGEKHKLMDMVADLQESGIVRWIRKIVIFLGVLSAIIGIKVLIPIIKGLIK